jgi:peptidyl-dipeptidase A
MWRSGYDMPADAQFTRAETERLYSPGRSRSTEALHCYVRGRSSRKKYTAKPRCPPEGLIPAHLLGNMWAQQWGNIYRLWLEPLPGQSQRSTSTAALRAGQIRSGAA